MSVLWLQHVWHSGSTALSYAKHPSLHPGPTFLWHLEHSIKAPGICLHPHLHWHVFRCLFLIRLALFMVVLELEAGTVALPSFSAMVMSVIVKSALASQHWWHSGSIALSYAKHLLLHPGPTNLWHWEHFTKAPGCASHPHLQQHLRRLLNLIRREWSMVLEAEAGIVC